MIPPGNFLNGMFIVATKLMPLWYKAKTLQEEKGENSSIMYLVLVAGARLTVM